MRDARPITVVSGVPRSGTSLMMQMLEAGGLPALTDGLRQADENNPHGYHETEAIKKMRSGAALPKGAPGKAVKCIHLLLEHLPADHAYDVLFMRRSLVEVVASQRKMLDREGKSGPRITDTRLIETFQVQIDRTLRRLDTYSNFRTLEVSHRQLLTDPSPVVDEVVAFLGRDLDPTAMRNVIDPSLYRQRAGCKDG